MAHRHRVEAFKMVVVVMSIALLVIPASADIQFPSSDCVDGNDRCPTLAKAGECSSKSTYMKKVCQLSCNLCSPTAAFPSQPSSPHPTTQQSTLTAIPTIEESIVPRRSIVNPDFECGGASLSAHSRKTRQVAFQEQQVEESPFATFGSGGDGAVQASCGASPISDRFLVTAAFCVLEGISSVRLGDIDLAQENENNSRPADYNIIKIYVHPEFNKNTRYHDIALLKTDRKIEFNDAVFPYCVPNSPSVPGTPVTAAGFGLINETHKSTHLMEVALRVIPMPICQAGYLRREGQRLNEAYPSLLVGRKGLLCVGDENSGICNGDEGGPAFRNDATGRRFLTGTISFTASFCGEGMLPGLVTSVADYVDFIDSIIYGREQS